MKILIAIALITLFYSCHNNGQKKEDLVCLGVPKPDLDSKEEIQVNSLQSIKEVIPPGYTIVETKEGAEVVYEDLNEDGKNDVVVLVEMHGDPSYEQSEEVLLMIFTADRHGQLQMVTASENLGGESVSYDDAKKLSVRKNVISYLHQSMRHHIILKFRYEIEKGDFMLIGKEFNSYGSIGDGPTHISINYLTGMKFIEQSEWSEEEEELELQEQQKETVSKKLKSLSTINWDNMYEDV